MVNTAIKTAAIISSANKDLDCLAESARRCQEAEAFCTVQLCASCSENFAFLLMGATWWLPRGLLVRTRDRGFGGRPPSGFPLIAS